MATFLALAGLLFGPAPAPAQEAGPPKARLIRVFVALCDNKTQGIVPVPKHLGNGDKPGQNLYWGALYGFKTMFRKSPDWDVVKAHSDPQGVVMERLLLKRETPAGQSPVYLLAEAYRGSRIKKAVKAFLNCSAGRKDAGLNKLGQSWGVDLQGPADLAVYIGHNGLMDFRLSRYPKKAGPAKVETIILACLSKEYFTDALRSAGARPLIWTTGLMAPESYTLLAALEGWVRSEKPGRIRERAAAAYAKYQKCGRRAARRLLVTGW